MKNFILLCLLISFSISNAQQVSQYKYIIIPEKFSDFDENQYQLNRYLNLLLTKKNYESLSQDNQTWPDDAKLNPCSVLTADVLKVKSFLKNKLEIVFTDCNNKEIAKMEGESKIKDYDKGYQAAMRTALNELKMQNAKSVPQEGVIISNPVKESTKIPENIPNPADQNENSSGYKNGNILLTKSDLKDGSFLLIQENNAQVFAQFYPSSKQGIFHVKVMNPKGENYFTIGYLGENSISIEMQNGPNQWKLTEFKK